MAKKYFWLKLSQSFIDSKTFRKFETMPDSDTLKMINLEILLRYLPEGGSIEVPESADLAEEIAIEIRRPFEKVNTVLNVLSKCGLIINTKSGCYVLKQLEELTGSESDSAKRMRKFRNKQNKIVHTESRHNVTDESQIVTQKRTDIDIDIEIDKDDDDKDHHPSISSSSYELLEYLNELTGRSFRSERHLKAIENQLKTNTKDEIKKVFKWCSENWLNDPTHYSYLNPSGICTDLFAEEWLPSAIQAEQKAKERKNKWFQD